MGFNLTMLRFIGTLSAVNYALGLLLKDIALLTIAFLFFSASCGRFCGSRAGPRTICGCCVWHCVEIKFYGEFVLNRSRRPPRHRRDACSAAWRWFLAARPSQHGAIVRVWRGALRHRLGFPRVWQHRKLREQITE